MTDDRSTSPMRPYDEEEVNLLDYWRVVWKRRWLIGSLCLSSVLVALFITIRMPKIYESTASILTPKEGGGGGLASALAGSGLIQQVPGISFPSLTANRDIFVSILKSRTMAEGVVEHFDLKERYGAEYLEDAAKALQGAINIKVLREGVISVRVEATDPKLAADIANFYVVNLDRLLARFGTAEAGRQRAFITDRLAKTKRELRQVEDALRRFQEEHKAIALEQQARGAVETTAKLRGEIVATEVQLQVMRNFATATNPEVVNLKKRIDEMKRQLAQMQYGKGWKLPSEKRNPGVPRKEIHVPFAEVPELSLKLARLTREVKAQETVYTLLTQQLEQVKIAEAQDMPLVQVLDRAVPAVRHSKPNVRLNMMLAGVVSLFGGIFLAFFLEYIENVRRLEAEKGK